MQIKHIITSLGVGGAEKMLCSLAIEFALRGVDQEIVCLKQGGVFGDELERRGIRVRSLKRTNSFSLLRIAFELSAAWRREPDVVIQTWLYHSDLLGLVIKIFAPRSRLFWGVRCGELDKSTWNPRSLLIRNLLSYASSACDGVIYNSNKGKEFHESIGYRCDRSIVIPNCVSIPKRESRLPAKGAFTFGFVGKYHPVKGVDVFLDFAVELSRINPSCRYVMMGRGIDRSNAELMAEVEKRGLDENCVLAGEQCNQVLYHQFDVLVITSRSEGFPNVLLEAMARGLICISSDVGDSAEILDDISLIFPSEDVTALTNIAIALQNMTNKEIRLIMCRNRLRATTYSVTAMADRYLESYGQVNKAR